MRRCVRTRDVKLRFVIALIPLCLIAVAGAITIGSTRNSQPSVSGTSAGSSTADLQGNGLMLGNGFAGTTPLPSMTGTVKAEMWASAAIPGLSWQITDNAPPAQTHWTSAFVTCSGSSVVIDLTDPQTTSSAGMETVEFGNLSGAGNYSLNGGRATFRISPGHGVIGWVGLMGSITTNSSGGGTFSVDELNEDVPQQYPGYTTFVNVHGYWNC